MENEAVELQEKLTARLTDISKAIELNENVIDLANGQLKAVKSQLIRLNRGGGINKNIDNVMRTLSNLSTNEQILAQKQVVKEQVLVLYIGSLESYLGDVIRTVGRVQPELFKFSDPKEKITFSQTMLQDGFDLGDAILDHITSRGISFQDLRSSIDAFDRYMDIHIELESELKDALILGAAARHIIVHNQSRIDRKFLIQIRSTRHSKTYEVGALIDVSDDLIKNTSEAVQAYANQITGAIVAKC